MSKRLDHAIAYHHYRQLERKIEELLARERPGDRDNLQNPELHDKNFRAYPTIVARYFPFSLWMFRFDDKQKRPLTVNINSYCFQRKKHADDVLRELGHIRMRASGSALLDEIQDTGKKLYILPYWKFGRTPLDNKDVNDFFGELGTNSTAQRFGVIDKQKKTSDCVIQYTASMWGEAHYDRETNLSTGTSGMTGPGAGPDDLLYHEMVHGSRMMRGVADSTKVDKGYDNVEEYIAVVLANIFMAEKKQQQLRSGHESFEVLANPKKFLDNNQHVNMSPRQLLRQFSNDQQDFFRRLACIPERKAWWNPVRELAREMGIQCGPARP
jgi:hypothetical protein